MKKTTHLLSFNNAQVFDFVMEILILVLLFFLPTIFDRRLGIVFSGAKVAWLRVFGVVFIGVWAIKLIVTNKHPFIRTPLDWPIMAFLLCTTVASLTSIHVYTSIVGFYGRYEGLISWYLFGILFFVVTNYIRTFAQIKRIVISITLAATLMAVYSIIQRHALDPYMWGGVITWQRVIGMIGQPNFLAAYMLMAFFLTLALFMLKNDNLEEKSIEKINWHEQLLAFCLFLAIPIIFLLMIYNLEAYNLVLWYGGFVVLTALAVLFCFTYAKLNPLLLNLILGLCLILNYVCILYTQSRGGYMGLFTGLVLFVVVAGRDWLFDNWKKLSILGFSIVLVSGITMINPEFSPFARFTAELSTGKDVNQPAGQEKNIEPNKDEGKIEFEGAAGSRGETWKSVFGVIADHPIFGIGPEVLKMVFPKYETNVFRFKEAFHVKQDRSHNESLDVAVTKGLISFVVYLWLLGVLFRYGWLKAQRAKPNDRLIIAGLLAASLAFLIQNQFSFGVVAITSLFWVIWGLVMVIGREDLGAAKPTSFSWQEQPWLNIAVVVVLAMGLTYLSFLSFRGDIWFKDGKTNIQMRRLQEAIADLEKSRAIFPYEGVTVSHLGISYLNYSYQSKLPQERTKYLNQAIDTLRLGIQIDPYNADNFYMLAKTYFMLASMGNKNELPIAKKYAEDALKIDPYYAEVYLLLGQIYEVQGQPSRALALYERSFAINPNLVEPMQQLANLHQRLGKQGETVKVFEEVLRQLPRKHASILNLLEQLSNVYIQNNQLNEALSLSQRMLEVEPGYIPAYICRTQIYIKKGQVEVAFSEIQQALIADPKNIKARLILGQIYVLKGDNSRSKAEFEQVLRLEPNNPFAKEMIKRLK